MVVGEGRASGAAGLLADEPVPVRLMNTVWADRRGVHDALRTPEDLSDWLRETGLSAERVGPEDVAAFRELRDALRRLAALVTDDPRPAAASPVHHVDRAVEEVNRAVDGGSPGPRLRLVPSGLERDDTPAGPAGALAAVAGRAVDLLTGRAGASLRACEAPSCVLYFVQDHPRRSWCSTACGNRARAARHYRRHRDEATGAPRS